MLRKKICLLGAFAVGKTSLVQRFVHSIFSEKYLTTLGVKIDKKIVHSAAAGDVTLMIWDLAGEDEFMTVRISYLRGAAGYILVADGTRAETLETARVLKARVDAEEEGLPFILLINKSDLRAAWQIGDVELAELVADGFTVFETSARSGANVDLAFSTITDKMLAPRS